MTYLWQLADTPAARVLRAIRMRGRASVKEVAADLGVTTGAVRLQLNQLRARGLVLVESVREGVGRPHFLYSTASTSHEAPDGSIGVLARLILEEVAGTQGRAGLQAVLDRVSDRLVELYGVEVEGREVGARVASWAGLLGRRGVAVTIEPTDEGYLLEQHECPYYAVAAQRREVCDVEGRVMTRLLGSRVQLMGCVLDGHRSCRFSISSPMDKE